MKKKKNTKIKKQQKKKKWFWFGLFLVLAIITLSFTLFSKAESDNVLGASTRAGFRLCNPFAGGSCQRSCNNSSQFRSTDACLWPAASGQCCYPKPAPKGFPAGGPGYPKHRSFF